MSATSAQQASVDQANSDGQQGQSIFYPIYIQYPQTTDGQYQTAPDGQHSQELSEPAANAASLQPGAQQSIAQTPPVAYVLAASPNAETQPVYIPIYGSSTPATQHQFREPQPQASSSINGSSQSASGSAAAAPPPFRTAQSKAKDLESGPWPPLKTTNLTFDSASVRAGFVKKVFALLTLMLVVVVAMIALFKFEENCNRYVRSHLWPYFLAYAVFFVTYLSIMCCQNVRRQYPINVIFLILVTVSMGYMTAMITTFHDTNVVFMSMAICALCCASVILFASQTKYDFTRCVGVVFVLCMVLIFFGLGSMIGLVFFKVKFLHVIYSGLVALVFMLFLAIDIQMLMGGKWLEYSPEDYIAVATQLFLDIVYIFIHMLGLSDGFNK